MVAKVLMITVASAAVAAATYFALDAKFPQTRTESATSNTGDVDAIFAGTLAPGAAGSGETAAAESASEAAAMDAPDEGTEVAAADDVSTTPDQAVETAAAPEPTIEPIVEPTPEPTVEPAPAPTAAAAAEPSQVPTAAPAPTNKPAPPQPAAAAPAKPTSKRAASKPALKPWWGPASEQRLSITYAGSAAYTRAIVLMFNGEFDDAGKAGNNLGVSDASGKPVPGSWQLGSTNKRMLLFPVSQNGTYTVSVKATLTDRNGRSLGAPAQGPVQVQ